MRGPQYLHSQGILFGSGYCIFSADHSRIVNREAASGGEEKNSRCVERVGTI
jgi:hypothetical protein